MSASGEDRERELEQLVLHERDGSVSFEVKVAPRASRAALTGVHGGALKLSLTSPPVDGAANEALIALLADRLGVPRRALRIVRGAHNRKKTLSVSGLTAAQVRAALQPPEHA